MPLHPKAAALLEQLARSGAPPLHTLSPEVARRAFDALFGRLNAARSGEGADLTKRDLTIPGPKRDIPLRLYSPQAPGPHPVLVYFHGGGFVLGTLDMYDSLCATLAREASCAVISVDYALAPEHPFPEPVEEAYAATSWIQTNGGELGLDPSRVAVGGDSAGGNLAAVVCLLNRDRGGPDLCGQLLIYPATDLSGQPFPSKKEYLHGYFLEREDLIWFQRNYLPNLEDARNPLASPLLAENLAGLPPAMVMTAEFDPLRDEGEAYAGRLRETGTPVHSRRYEGMIHGFVSMGDVFPEAREALKEIGRWLRDAFAGKTGT